MWARFSVGLALLLLLSVLSFGQSFEDAKVYQVTGRQLNQLETDKNTLKTSLLQISSENATLTTENLSLVEKVKTLSEKLATESQDRLADSLNKQMQLDEANSQLIASNLLLTKYEAKTLTDKIVIGVGSFMAGAIIVEVLHGRNR